MQDTYEDAESGSDNVEPRPAIRPPPRPLFEPIRASAPPQENGGGGIGVPELHSPREPAFRVVELRVDADGGVHARVRFILTEKIYRSATAVRFAEYRAKEAARDDFVYVVLNSSGRAVAVVASGTGRRVTPQVASRARRLVRQHLPEFAPKKRRSAGLPKARRTSKTGVSALRGGSRRTSRSPARKTRGR